MATTAVTAGVVLLLSGWWFGQSRDTLRQISGPTMGTTYTVKVVESSVPGDRMRADIVVILDRIDARMSTYRADSEVTRFNRSRSTEWFAVSEETRSVVDTALQVSNATGGAFDITVAALVDLWGFGPAAGTQTPPAPEQIQAKLERTGYRHLETRSSPPAVRKNLPEIEIDLSAIAKGHAVDQVAEYLESQGIHRYLVEIGGELRAKGTNADNLPWVIAIERPVPYERTVHTVIQIIGTGMATSGDYRNFFERDGKRFSHTIDPRTGMPVTHDLASVSVVGPSVILADAMATALMALGPDDGFQFAQAQNLAALFIQEHPEGFRDRATASFRRYVTR